MTAGQKALEDTPNLLPVLKKAGVVDAGGQGIMVIFEGMGKVFHGEGIVQAARLLPTRQSSPPRTPARACSPTT